jgi:hypothetical protein
MIVYLFEASLASLLADDIESTSTVQWLYLERCLLLVDVHVFSGTIFFYSSFPIKNDLLQVSKIKVFQKIKSNDQPFRLYQSAWDNSSLQARLCRAQ